jgi:hypothetical protein
MQMTLVKTVLAKASKWKTAERRTLTVPDEGSGWTVSLTADRCDDLGCLLWEVALQRSAGPIAADAAGLQVWAERVVNRVTGLLEPLRLIEAARLEAQLRSESPTARDEERFYYELLLKAPGIAQLRRYQAADAAGKRRTQVAFALTHEVLAKLAGDLAAEK